MERKLKEITFAHLRFLSLNVYMISPQTVRKLIPTFKKLRRANIGIKKNFFAIKWTLYGMMIVECMINLEYIHNAYTGALKNKFGWRYFLILLDRYCYE